MAQPGDTITYTYSDGTSVSEDISDVNEAVVDYCDGAGGVNGTSGGRVENATIDLSGYNTLYIWVASQPAGRYNAETVAYFQDNGAGSTEISFSDTSEADLADAEFLVGSGGGGSNGAGARSPGSGDQDPPPEGGDGIASGKGAIDDQNRGLVSGGTTIKGGGSGPDTDGEIQITYKPTLSPPDPPSNMTAEVQ